MYKNILYVAAGGALGSVLRYAISLVPLKTDFPFQTFITNIAGALLIGFIATFAVLRAGQTAGRVPAKLLLLLKTGFCGGFTTFSTFSLETLSLFEKGHGTTAAVYALLSLAAGTGAVLLGEFLAELTAD
ncbi:MAG: fluoride efflux transporter CrcB [Treponema sp.]|nr:fluoride efflux transporter CrcB [Treponema sp.]